MERKKKYIVIGYTIKQTFFSCNNIFFSNFSKKGVWINNVRMGTTEVQLKNNTIISFKESDEAEPCKYYLFYITYLL